MGESNNSSELFQPIRYFELNARQKENYNFHKLSARLADYGYNCLRLTDDWKGADLLACHIDGETVLKIQLKGRLALDKKYFGKSIYIGFFAGTRCFVFPHDAFADFAISSGRLPETGRNWRDDGFRNWKTPPKWALAFLEQYEV